jgi:hypothetical protein
MHMRLYGYIYIHIYTQTPNAAAAIMAAISGATKTAPSSSKIPKEPIKTAKSTSLEKTKQKKDVEVKDDNDKDKKGNKQEKNEKEKGKDNKKSLADKDKVTTVPTNVAGTFFLSLCFFFFFNFTARKSINDNL